tara:strand:+ start:178 stop:369 length:192 start_codon:yes stop_codon:yes gene_type:complete
MRSISGVGEHERTMCVWNTEDGFYIQAGCFFGSSEEFKEAVMKKYGGCCTYLRSLDFLTSEWS